MRTRSLRAIMTFYVGAFLLALVGIRTVNYTLTDRLLTRQADQRLATELVDIAGSADAPPSLLEMAARIRAAEDRPDTADLFFMLTAPDGRQLAGHYRLPTRLPAGYADVGHEAGLPAVSHGRTLTRQFGDGSVLTIVADHDQIDGFDSTLFRVQLLGLFLTATFAIGGGIAITLTIGARMRAMQRTVDAVMSGDLKSRIPLDGSGSDFDLQAEAFNRMLDRIDALMENIRHAAKDVAHEMKSPLSRLRAETAALARRHAPDPTGADFETLLDRIDGALDLFASLQRLWEIEGGRRRAHFAEVDLVALAHEAEDALSAVAEDAGQRLVLSLPPRAVVRGDANLLRQLVVNLVENAIRHTPRGALIRLEVDLGPGGPELVVADDGPGIPADKHALVVRRFGRLEQAGGAPGQGLGLTLVDAIARLHGGSLVLADAAPGLRAVVRIAETPETR